MGTYPCNPAISAVIIYIILIIIIIIIKPHFLYDHSLNKFKEFGTNHNQTYIPLLLFGILSSIILYYGLYFINKINCKQPHLKYLMKYV